MLFIDFTSAFNTIVTTRLAGKLIEMGVNTPLCAWILDFLTAKLIEMGVNNPLCAWILDFLTAKLQVIRVGRHTSRPLTLNTGSPPRVASSAPYCTPCPQMTV